MLALSHDEILIWSSSSRQGLVLFFVSRCDDVANGFIEAYNIVKPSVPIVMRLQGTNAAEGRAIIEEANIPNLQTAETLTDAAQKAVAAAKGGN